MEKEINLTIEKARELGGIEINVNELGRTKSKSINKLIKNNLFQVKPNDKLIYLVYSNSAQIQVVFKIIEGKTNLVILYWFN